MANERDFKIKIETTGADQAVAAQQQVTAAQTQSTAAVDAGAVAADRMHLSTQGVSQILNKLSPELAAAFQSSVNFSRILERMGEEGKTVEGILGLLGEGVKKYSGAILTLGAAGLAAASIAFLISQWNKLGEEMNAVIEAQKEFNKLQEDEASKRQAGREDVLQAAIGAGKAPTQEQLDRASQLLGGVGLRGTVDQSDAAKALGQLIDRIDSMDVDKLELMALLVSGGTDISRAIPGRELAAAQQQLESLRAEEARKRGLAAEGRDPFRREEMIRRGVSPEAAEKMIQGVAGSAGAQDIIESLTTGQPFIGVPRDTGIGGSPVPRPLSDAELQERLALILGVSASDVAAFLAALRKGGGGGSTTINVYNNARIQQSGAASDVVSNGDRNAGKAEG